MSDLPKPIVSMARPVVVTLIVSLCVNLLLIGALSAYLWRSDTIFGPRYGASEGPSGTWGPDGGRGMGPMRGDHRRGAGFGLHGPLSPHALADIAPDKAAVIRQIVADHRETLKSLRQASMKARQDAAQTLAEEPYSSQDFTRALDRVRANDTALETEILAIVAQAADKLSPEERKAVRKYRPPERGGQDGRGPGPYGGGP